MLRTTFGYTNYEYYDFPKDNTDKQIFTNKYKMRQSLSWGQMIRTIGTLREKLRILPKRTEEGFSEETTFQLDH